MASPLATRDGSVSEGGITRSKRHSVRKKVVARGGNERSASKHHRGKKRISKRK